MRCTQRKAFLGLVALTLAAATPALAQDTTATGRTPQPGADSLTLPGQGGAADTAGYSGMERNDPSGARDPGAQDTGAVETGAVRTDTGAVRTDTGAAVKPDTGAQAGSPDPNGFKWTEPKDFTQSGPPAPSGAAGAGPQKQPADTLTLPGQRGGADTSGFAGMERDTSAQHKPKDKPHKTGADSTKS
jgi:hypothetical protein